MTITNKIYNAVDDFGLITSAEALELGITNTELVQQARRGKLVRVARGVYRMPVWPYQEQSTYAIAVKAAGKTARLSGESVIALLKLAPTNPSHLFISSPDRVRRNIGDGVRIGKCSANDSVVYYEGIPSQPLTEAIIDAAQTMGVARALEAAQEALHKGYLTQEESTQLIKELKS